MECGGELAIYRAKNVTVWGYGPYDNRNLAFDKALRCLLLSSRLRSRKLVVHRKKGKLINTERERGLLVDTRGGYLEVVAVGGSDLQ